MGGGACRGQWLPAARPPTDTRCAGDPASAGVSSSGTKLNGVVDDARQDRLRRDVHDPRTRRAQQAQHEAEEPLLVRPEHRRERVGQLEAERVDDDHGSLQGPTLRDVTAGQRSRSRA